MIDWYWVFTSSLWIAGLALILAAVGVGRHWRRPWQRVIGTPWVRCGGLLVCAGQLLGSASWIERAPWGLLGLAVGVRWWQAASDRETVAGAGVAPAPAPASPGRAWLPRAARLGADRIIRGEPLLLLAAAPLFLFPTRDRAAVFLLLPLLALARAVARGRFFVHTPLDWPLALLALMVPISLYATPDLENSLGKIAGLVFGLAWYGAAVEWLTTRRRLAWAVAAYALAGTALATVALIGTQWGQKLPVLSAVVRRLPQRVVRLPGAEDGFQPNQVGGALLWIVPVLLALAAWAWMMAPPGFARRWRLRAATAAPLGITGGTLVLTQSRSALLGLAAALLFLGVMLVTRAPKVRWALATVALAVGGAVVILGPAMLTGRAATAAQGAGEELGSLASRTEIWARALYALRDFPLTGMGMNNFRRVVPVLYPFFSLPPTIDIAHAHNQFLQAGLDLGLAGLIAYLALWMIGAALTVRCLRRADAGWTRALALGLGAALLASFIFGLTDAIALGAKPGILFWSLLALLVALERLPYPPPARPAAPDGAAAAGTVVAPRPGAPPAAGTVVAPRHS